MCCYFVQQEVAGSRCPLVSGLANRSEIAIMVDNVNYKSQSFPLPVAPHFMPNV